MQKYEINNKIWNMPYLAPIAEEVSGASTASRCLSNRCYGEWEFSCNAIADIPLPTAQNQDYNFESIPAKNWQNVIVPSSLTMQGFDIKNNIEYYYKAKIAIDKDALESKLGVYIRFEGVYCNSRIWINNHYITTHTGGFTPFVVDITDYLNGLECDLVIGITDIEGTDKGIWNPNGQKVSDASWGSYYAHNNICGILRDVTLYYLPQNYVLSCKVNAGLAADNKLGVLKSKILLNLTENTKINVEVLDNNSKIVFSSNYDVTDKYKIDNEIYTKNFSLDFNDYSYINVAAKMSDKKYSELYCSYNRPKLKGNLYGIETEEIINNITPWNAESPALYTLKITLISDNKNSCVYLEKIGFRTIDFAGSNGTDKNKIYVNGMEVKLRGVCRHDISYQYGRSLTKENELAEIKSFKANNINHIRTSHYPCSKHYLQLCDEYGIYVELENAVCFKGGNGYDMYCSTEQIIQNLSEMIEFNYNHPSVLILSTANESGFEKSLAYRLSYNYVKEKDLSRPVIFSYPNTVKSKPVPYDIFSKHYHRVYKFLGDKNMPKLHDEFAHIACYNLKDLAKDNNYRIAWGKSIAMGWDNIMKSDGALGCALWGGIDDVFYLPDNISVAHQRHSASKALGYGEWGAVLDVFKREKPEAYLTKKAFSPIKMSDFKQHSDKIAFKLNNRFDHTNLREVSCIVKGNEGDVLFESKLNCDIPPRKCGNVQLCLNVNDNSKLDIAFYFGGYEVEREIFALENNNKNTIINNTMLDTVNLIVDKKNAVLKLTNSEDETAAIGPYLYIKNKKIKGIYRTVTEVNQGNVRTVTIKENFGPFRKAAFEITALNNGEINVKLSISEAMAALIGNDYGVGFELNEKLQSVEWNKETQYSYYPPNHLERPQGKALLTTKNTDYGVMPNNAWKDDSYNYFLNNEGENDRLYVTNDFKTNRTNIKEYGVNLDSCSLWIKAKDKNINCITDYCKIVDYIDCKSNKIRNKGSWKIINRNNEKCCAVSRKKGSSVTLDFEGVGIKIYGTRSKEQGVISIAIDGKNIKEVSTRSDICDVLDFMILDTVTNLTNGKHTITVTLNDDKGVRISGFETISNVGNGQKSHIYINRGRYYKSLGWGNYCGERLSFAERKGFAFNIALTKSNKGK